MELRDLVLGREAADIFGATRPEEVWRAVKRHGDAYPGALTLHVVGRSKAVARDELREFAAWYRANVSRNTRPGMERSPVEKAAPARPRVGNGRRAALREAIRRIETR